MMKFSFISKLVLFFLLSTMVSLFSLHIFLANSLEKSLNIKECGRIVFNINSITNVVKARVVSSSNFKNSDDYIYTKNLVKLLADELNPAMTHRINSIALNKFWDGWILIFPYSAKVS